MYKYLFSFSNTIRIIYSNGYSSNSIKTPMVINILYLTLQRCFGLVFNHMSESIIGSLVSITVRMLESKCTTGLNPRMNGITLFY